MEILENALKTIPGLALVFAVAALLLLDDNSEMAAVFRVFVVAWCLYRLSSFLDWLIFDFAYGPRSVQKPTTSQHQNPLSKGFRILNKRCNTLRSVLPCYMKLEKRRGDAAEHLGLGSVEGVYGKAKEAMEKTGDWKEIMLPLSFSKAARAFIVPFFIIFIIVMAIPGRYSEFLMAIASLGKFPLLGGFRADFARAQEKLEFFKYPAIPAVVCFVSLFTYLSLRIHHLNKLYDLVTLKVPKKIITSP